MKLYLDNCCYNRPFDDQTQLKINLESQAKLFVQQQICSGAFQLVWSYVLEYENLKNPFDERMKAIAPWRGIAGEYVEENEQVVTFAESLVFKGIKIFDALHVSCAVYKKCDYFLTTDKKLLNLQVNEIKILNPVDFIRELEE